MCVMASGSVKHHKDLLQNKDDRHVQLEALRNEHGEEISGMMEHRSGAPDITDGRPRLCGTDQ